jgi:5-methylcytosine-specific restriction endonuclease McrA
VERVCTVNGCHSRAKRSAKGESPREPDESSGPIPPPPSNAALSASVLVLNRLYMAVHIINIRRAFCLLYRDLAEVIHYEEGHFTNYSFETWLELSNLHVDCKQSHEDWIRGVNFEILAPRVIRLMDFDRVPKQHLHLNRRTILARDEHICQYCGRHYPTSQLSIDHVIPRSRGGGMTWENVVCACLACNTKKGGHTPHEARMKLVRHPKRPNHNPMLVQKLSNPKYEIWRTWLNGVFWDIGTKE